MSLKNSDRDVLSRASEQVQGSSSFYHGKYGFNCIIRQYHFYKWKLANGSELQTNN